VNSLRFQADECGLVLACAQCGRSNRLAYDNLDRQFRCGNCKTLLSAPAEPVDIPNANVFGSLTRRSGLPVLVDFWASWCGPCKMVAPELVKVAQQSAGKWLVAKLDTEALPDVAAHYGIQSIPTLAVFRAGREIQRQAGAMQAPRIIDFMQQAI
jgi:thioredoxin 2